MSKQQIFKSVFLGGLVLGTLAFGSFKANATGINQNISHATNFNTSTIFNSTLEIKLSNLLANRFVESKHFINRSKANL